jgi:hypothetical protein
VESMESTWITWGSDKSSSSLLAIPPAASIAPSAHTRTFLHSNLHTLNHDCRIIYSYIIFSSQLHIHGTRLSLVSHNWSIEVNFLN